MHSYDYSKRTGIEPITWERFAELSRSLAEQLVRRRVEVVVGIARAGLFPATAIACALRCELFPVRVTRRENDEVRYERPIWKVPLAEQLGGRRVAVVDEIADTGVTLELVRTEALAKGASEALGAALVTHSWTDPIPACYALQSDALVLFPWDRQVLHEGRWIPHPELEEALRLQKRG